MFPRGEILSFLKADGILLPFSLFLRGCMFEVAFFFSVGKISVYVLWGGMVFWELGLAWFGVWNTKLCLVCRIDAVLRLGLVLFLV